MADVFRCPTYHNSSELAQAFFAYQLIESGVWPAAGGLCDQSASFVAFVQAVGAERNAIDQDKREREQRKAR